VTVAAIRVQARNRARVKADGEEPGGTALPKPGATGDYDPLAWYDYFDVPVPAVADPDPNGTRNQAVTMGDVLAVLLYVGGSRTCATETTCGDALPPNSPACCTETPNPNGVDYDIDKDGNTVADGRDYDRSPSTVPNPPWDAGPPNDAVNMQDVLAVLAQVGLDYSSPPP
jgi:hypothetical protein